MKTFLLTSALSLVIMSDAFASASVRIQVHKEGGELKVINDSKKTGFIERGGKNYWSVTYFADPGTYIMTGENPGCAAVVQPTFFEEGKSYSVVLTEDCRIESS